MKILKMPLDNHYCLISPEGFSTFLIQNYDMFEVQDVPMRFCFNVMYGDSTDQKLIKDSNHFMEEFKFNMLKYIGAFFMLGRSTLDVFKKYEKPLQDIYDQQNKLNRAEMQYMLQHINIKKLAGKEVKFRQSPLFVFTRNGMPQ